MEFVLFCSKRSQLNPERNLMNTYKDWENQMKRSSIEELNRFIVAVLENAGTRGESAEAVAKALCTASIQGVDSHGVRLLPHYERVVQEGRVNGRSELQVREVTPVAVEVNADNGFGHYASYRAIEEGIQRAKTYGITMISVINSSHLGALGSYVAEAAHEGFLAFGFSNTDTLVLPHGATKPFHGTNPIAFAAPVDNSQPYLIDMATSCVPWNRVADYGAQGRPLPDDIAVDKNGHSTKDHKEAVALKSFGGADYSYKGAALGGMIEILCSPLTGMPFCAQILKMNSVDMSVPRHLGQFFMVLKPDLFVSRVTFMELMQNYLHELRSLPAQEGVTVMAPGDREWLVREERSESGVPIPAYLEEEFKKLGEKTGVKEPEYT
jgi:LDH2 family malate/lactate/ureidoglycolate dehydrogenase